MRLFAFSTAVLAAALPAAAIAAGVAVIDLNAKPRAFSAADYDKMLACTLKSHPDETRRYSAYHLSRRDVQTPAQNESDPDSKLFFPALKGCFEIKNGEVFPFSLDRLVRDWGKAHNIAMPTPPAPIATTDQLAECAIQNNPQLVARILAAPRPMGAIQNINGLFSVRCRPANGFKLDIDQLYSKFDQLSAEKAERGVPK